MGDRATKVEGRYDENLCRGLDDRQEEWRRLNSILHAANPPITGPLDTEKHDKVMFRSSADRIDLLPSCRLPSRHGILLARRDLDASNSLKSSSRAGQQLSWGSCEELHSGRQNRPSFARRVYHGEFLVLCKHRVQRWLICRQVKLDFGLTSPRYPSIL
jgi:hypothetical protein